VEYFYPAHSKKSAVRLTFLLVKENRVIFSYGWITKECAGNMWLRGLRKCH